MMTAIRIDPASDALLLEDVQVDFCPGGALPVPAGDEVVPVLNRWLAVTGLFAVASRDWHPADHCSFQPQGGRWPAHCVQNSPGAAFHPDLLTDRIDLVIAKATDSKREEYSTFARPELEDALRRRGLCRIWLGGLATEYCVKETALDGRRRGFEVFVIEDGIRGIEATPGDCARALMAMRDAGCRVVRTDDVLARTLTAAGAR